MIPIQALYRKTHGGEKLPSFVSEKIRAMLVKYGIPNYPQTGAQGSQRMYPGVMPWDLLGPNSHLLIDAMREFLAQELAWRGHDDGSMDLKPNPKPCVVHDTYYEKKAFVHGPEPLSGNVSLADAQHFELRPQLSGAELLASEGAIAVRFADRGNGVEVFGTHIPLISQVTWLNRWIKERLSSELNPRAVGWIERANAEIYFAMREAKVSPSHPAYATCIENIRAITKRYAADIAKWQGHAADIKFLLRNTNGLKQADHGNFSICPWMQGEATIGRACSLAVLQAAGISNPAEAAQYLRGLDGLIQALEMGEEMSPGHPQKAWFPPADYDIPFAPDTAGVATSDHFMPRWLNPANNGSPGPMQVFLAVAAATAQTFAPDRWETKLRDRLKAHYDHTRRYRFGQMALYDHHALSTALVLGPIFGYKT